MQMNGELTLQRKNYSKRIFEEESDHCNNNPDFPVLQYEVMKKVSLFIVTIITCKR